MSGRAHPLQQLQGLFVGFGLGHQLQLGGGQGDVLFHCHVGEQVELLEHHAHPGAELVDVVFGIGDVHASKVMVPEVGSSSRFRQRRKVDLPEPEGPIMATFSPWRYVR